MGPEGQEFSESGEQQPPVDDVSSPVDNQSGGGHPAWQEILDAVPQMFHDKVRPTLEKWDRGVNDKLAKTRSEWEDYQFLKEHGINAQTVNYALNILGSLQKDPRQFYDSMAEYYKFATEDISAKQGQVDYEDTLNGKQQPTEDPRIAKMQQDMEIMAAAIYGEQQRQREAQEDAALETELGELRNKYGDFDELYVLSLVAQGQDPETAIRAFKDTISRYGGQATPQPQILGSGGGAPSGGEFDPRKLSDRDTKTLVAQMLERAAQQGA